MDTEKQTGEVFCQFLQLKTSLIKAESELEEGRHISSLVLLP